MWGASQAFCVYIVLTSSLSYFTGNRGTQWKVTLIGLREIVLLTANSEPRISHLNNLRCSRGFTDQESLSVALLIHNQTQLVKVRTPQLSPSEVDVHFKNVLLISSHFPLGFYTPLRFGFLHAILWRVPAFLASTGEVWKTFILVSIFRNFRCDEVMQICHSYVSRFIDLIKNISGRLISFRKTDFFLWKWISFPHYIKCDRLI